MRVLFHIGQSTVEPIPQAVVSARRISKLDVTMDIGEMERKYKNIDLYKTSIIPV